MPSRALVFLACVALCATSVAATDVIHYQKAVCTPAVSPATGFTVAMHSECTNNACTTGCESTPAAGAAAQASPYCVEVVHGGTTEYVKLTCNADGTKVEQEVFDGAGCTGAEEEAEHKIYDNDECTMEDPHVQFTCTKDATVAADTSSTVSPWQVTLKLKCADGCATCEETRNCAGGADAVTGGCQADASHSYCFVEDHDGTMEYLKVTCEEEGTEVHAKLTIYDTAGCTGTVTEEEVEFVSGACSEDGHGHDDHAVAPASEISPTKAAGAQAVPGALASALAFALLLR